MLVKAIARRWSMPDWLPFLDNAMGSFGRAHQLRFVIQNPNAAVPLGCGSLFGAGYCFALCSGHARKSEYTYFRKTNI